MIYSVTFSKPSATVAERLGRDYKKIKIKLETSSSSDSRYFVEMFTETQVFHKRITAAELDSFIEENVGKSFKNCVVRTDSEEITYLTNKKGKVTRLVKKVNPSISLRFAAGNYVASQNDKSGDSVLNDNDSGLGVAGKFLMADNKKKNYLLPVGVPVPFLVRLGVMTADGKVINSKYDKFRQINRFLEFINDVLSEFENRDEPIKILDFGCGKSYLTFAVHYFLTEVKKIPCQIEGLDLKKDVIDYCNRLVSELGLKNIHFSVGDISNYSGEKSPDIVIALHACDTATDFALKYAVNCCAKVILCVPCCQHEVNKQLQERKGTRTRCESVTVEDNPRCETVADNMSDVFEPLLKWGIVREKFASLVTDAIRAEWLESQGYNVQMLEFIDMEHTPKNILIRAILQMKLSSGVLGVQPLGEGGGHFVTLPSLLMQTRIGGDCPQPKLVTALGINPEILKN